MKKRKIRLFVDCHSFDKEYQGVQTFLRGLYNAFLEKYEDVDVYFGALNVDNIKRNFPLAKIENLIQYRNRRSGFLRYFTRLPSIISKYEIDIAHFQYIVPPFKKNCDCIVTLHDIVIEDFPSYFPWRYRILRKWLFKSSFLSADIKTTVSAYSKERIAFHYRLDKSKIGLVSNGVDESMPQSFKNKSNAVSFIKAKYGIENFILYVSRIEPRKNHLLLLTTYLDLKLYKKDIRLVFIGKPSIKYPELTAVVSQLVPSARECIHWFSQVAQEDLAAFYLSARVFVYPSEAEGFGIPPLEAAICKVPVLCSNTTAMKEFSFFEPYLFDPNNEIEFKEKLESIINCPPGEQFLETISKVVLQKYSWDRSAAQLYELIKKYS